MKEDRSKNLNDWNEKPIHDLGSLRKMKEAVVITMILLSLMSFLLGLAVAILAGG